MKNKRLIACWILAALIGLSFYFMPGSAPWYQRLLAVLIFEVLIGAWCGLLLYVQNKAADPTPEGEAFRGPMPTSRAVFWTCAAGVGVFFCLQPSGQRPSLFPRLFAALFSSLFIGGFAFMANWLRGDQGKIWARKYARQLAVIYGLAISGSLVLKLFDLVAHK